VLIFIEQNQQISYRPLRKIEAFYKSGSYDHIFLDTAGRLHVENSLLKELQEIDTSFGAHYKILVLDSMTGQESLSVAQAFNSVVPFSYAIFTKMDSDTRGGAAFAFSYVIKKPIIFTGVGERPEDLEKFNPERAAGKILGMGDVLTLVEKAEEKIKVEDQEKMAKTLMSGKFNLNDFLNQITMIEKMGSFSKLVKYMPNVGGMSLSDSQIEQSERDTKRFKAIIQSMTLKERFNPDLLNGSSKLRIAKGSGSKVEDVNLLLDRFEQSKQFAKILKKYNKFF
jgi:signal recognition particle subunit SRP54